MKRLWLLLALLLLAYGTRLYHLAAQSLWFDEGWSAFAARQTTLWDAALADATNPPLYYVLLNMHTRLSGDSEFALRWFSLALSLLLIALLYMVGRRLFGARAGLWAALLATVSPPLWWAAQEARMYTLLALLVTLAAFAWHRLIDGKTARRCWLLLWGAQLALLYAHNSGPVIALWLNAMTLLLWLLRRALRVPDWRVWFGGQIVVGLLWLPYFFARFVDVQQANSSLIRRPVLTPAFLADIWQALWTGNWALVGREPLLVAACALVFALCLLCVPWKLARARWLLAHVVVLIAALLLGLSVLGNELHGRYLVMIVPLLLLPLAAGLARLRGRGLRYATAAFFAALLLLNMHYITQDKAYQHDDARALVQYYAQTLETDDTVIVWSYAERYELAYYWPRLGVRARLLTLPEGADFEEVALRLPRGGGDVALNVWYTQRADFRGMLGCLLANGTSREPEVYSVYGMTSYLYPAWQMQIPLLRALNVNIAASAQLLTAGTLPAQRSEQALCLPLHLRLRDTLHVDLKAAVRVTNDLGWEIARAEAVFADASQRLSSEAPAGTLLAAYALLWLPPGTPAGTYHVDAVIYDEQAAPAGYEVLSDAGTPAGRTLPLGAWTTTAGSTWTGADVPSDGLRVDENLRLLQTRAPQSARSGDSLPLTLLWSGTGALPALTLAADNGDWQIAIPARYDAQTLTLDWRAPQIPLDAASGSAALRLPDGQVIATVQISALAAQLTPPPFALAVNQALVGVGTLVGYTPDDTVSLANADFGVTLVWQAAGATAIDYTVFVQLLDADGRVIAQSDAAPAQNTRPTTGWRTGEYISDAHRLRFNENARAGSAALIAGMYDPRTMQRVGTLTLATLEVRAP
ncbi:MAG: glycosyltransferase family 39 protein [Chloroflexi bacterium]|nr:glycosyltransferase family 39 protein [Chloroflexota bacterium]